MSIHVKTVVDCVALKFVCGVCQYGMPSKTSYKPFAAQGRSFWRGLGLAQNSGFLDRKIVGNVCVCVYLDLPQPNFSDKPICKE
jgi:hypothetical protein